MRTISIPATVVFILSLFLVLIFSFLLTPDISQILDLKGPFNAIIGIIIFISVFYILSIALFRLFLLIMPVDEGYIPEGSRQEFNYNVYLLFRIVLFFPVIRTKFLPVPLTRPLYICLGARLGANTYSGGTILDPPLTVIGSNTIIGEDALLYSHAIEGRSLSHAMIHIGSNVTIGAKSIIMSGVTIGNNSIIAAGSVVLKNTQIGDNEIWGGVPAKFIKKLMAQQIPLNS